MTLRRTQMVMSAPPYLRLPRLDSDIDRRVLATPERRQATAMLRREWMESRQGDRTEDRTLDVVKLRKERTHLRKTKAPTNREKYKSKTEKTSEIVFTEKQQRWQEEIAKSNIAERLPFFHHIRLTTAPTRDVLSDSPRTAMPMFHVARVTLHPAEKQRNRMHFINKDWSSEKVSWRRFNHNVSDFHKRSWIE